VPPSRAPWRYLVFLFLIAPVARAQEPGETIEVEGDRSERSSRAPATAGTVIDLAQFSGEIRSVAELLLTAPGVSVHALGGPGQAATLSLRGATADESLVLLDGIPLQGPGGGAIDLATLPVTLLERVVVNRGVLGAQFGAGALGGAVELLPRRARDSATGGVLLSAGSFGTFRAALDGAAPAGDGSAVFAAQLDRTAGKFDYARQLTPGLTDAPYYGYTRQNADSTRGSALARLAQSLTASTELDLLAQGSIGDRGLPGPASAITLHARELDQSVLGGIRLRGATDRAAWSARAWGRLDRVELRGVQAFGDCVDGAAECPRSDQRASAVRGEAEGELAAGDSQWLSITLSAGQERVHGRSIGAHRRDVFSLAARDDVTLPRGLELHPGLRLDKSGSDAGVSPALTASWRATDLVELRAGWGLSFRPATLNELYLESGGIISNPDLRPERAWSLDAGATLRSGDFTVSGGLFWSKYRDLIVYDLFPPAKVKPHNVGSARIAGAELQVLLRLPAGVIAQAAYSWLDAVNLRPGAQENHRLPYRPPHRLFLRVARRGDRLETYAESGFTSALPRNSYDSAYVAAQLVVNAGVGVRAAGPLWIHFEARNLLDNQTLEDLFQYPLPGRSIALIARARL
jgi:outer membrane cobalamin receptor